MSLKYVCPELAQVIATWEGLSGDARKGPETAPLSPDHAAELDALARLAATLAKAAADDSSPAVHAMAQALSVKLGALAVAVRLS